LIETNAVSTVVESLALSRPHIGFFLRVDGRGFLALPAAADLRERVAQVHGLSLARSLVTLDEAGGPVWGLVSPLSVSFPTRRYLHVAVNGRVVDTDSFAPAVAKAYADLLPKSACEFGGICPHGRPIVKRILLADVLREFGRI
jgi:DNA mismatch repair protein MutL